MQKDNLINQLENELLEAKRKVTYHDETVAKNGELNDKINQLTENNRLLNEDINNKRFKRIEIFNYFLRLVEAIYKNLNITFLPIDLNDTIQEGSYESEILKSINNHLKELIIKTSKK